MSYLRRKVDQAEPRLALLAGCPDLALAAERDELIWRRSRLIRGLKHLPVTFTPRPRGEDQT